MATITPAAVLRRYEFIEGGHIEEFIEVVFDEVIQLVGVPKVYAVDGSLRRFRAKSAAPHILDPAEFVYYFFFRVDVEAAIGSVVNLDVPADDPHVIGPAGELMTEGVYPIT